MGTKPLSLIPHLSDKTLAGVPTLLTDLRTLLDDVTTTDVLFLVGQEKAEFRAHKLILNARCSRFQQVEAGSNLSAPHVVLLPDTSSDTFQDVLLYIYTGQVSLVDSSVFGVLAVARYLGVHDLSHHCEGHILSTLSAHNVCTFYSAARSLEKDNPEYELRGDGFLSMCAAFIEENAEVCVRTDGWLRLTQDDVIDLISSESFSLEEEDVWRAVLSWAKYQAGVPLDKHPTTWSERDKAAVGQHLSGVIHHVKLLLIDSRVFAEEVEPTGAVPMELSLERYRYAAVPATCSQSEDKRLCPRVSNKLFIGTEILAGDKLQHQRLLNTWYGDAKQTWQLLYRASRDGYGAEDFHRHCDGHSPTFTVILGTTGSICGGFSDVPWTSKTPPRGRYIPSHKAFLFTLCNQQGVPPTKYEVISPKFATLHHPRYGPMFGAGADLCVANGCEAGMQCYSNMPHSYSGPAASPAVLMGDFNFNVRDYEVFTTTENMDNIV